MLLYADKYESDSVEILSEDETSAVVSSPKLSQQINQTISAKASLAASNNQGFTNNKYPDAPITQIIRSEEILAATHVDSESEQESSIEVI